MVRRCGHTILVCGILVLCLVLMMSSSVSGIDLPYDPSIFLGTISVSSNPSGADVIIDGTNYGPTPFSTALMVGTHQLLLQRGCYADYNTNFEITSQTTTTLDITLTEKGSLTVRSTPSGADVSIHGSYVGTTPFTANCVENGLYSVSVKMEGYQEASTTVGVSAGSPSSYNAVLVRLPTTGTFVLSSVPSGAAVYIEGEARGTTPTTLTGVNEGSHMVTFKKAGYQDFTAEIGVHVGETIHYTATLEPEAPAGGSISARSTPSGAAVYLDNVPRGTTPTTITGVTAATHTMKFTKSGYNDYTTTVTVANGATTPVDVTLVASAPSPSGGSIAISSIPTGAAVYLDNVARGTTPTTLTGVTAATHTVKVSLAGYQDVTKTVTVVAGQTTQVTATLPAGTTGTGSLTVASVPSGATVFLDGTSRGTTPATLTGISAGPHTLKLSKAGYQDNSLQVTVATGKTTPISLTLQQGTGGNDDTGTLVVVSSPTGAEIVLDDRSMGTTPATLTGVIKGTHILTLRMDGYQDHTETVTVNAGETQQASAILEKEGGGMATPGFGGAIGIAALLFLVLGCRKRLLP